MSSILSVTYMVVNRSVVADASVPPEGLHGHSCQQNVGVVDLVVVGHPGSDESPEGLHGGVGSESGDLLWLPL